MAGLVSEDVPAGGPNASLKFGEATENARLQREVASRSGVGAPPAQPQAPPMALPAGAQPEPAQPPPQGRLDMNQVFPPMPEIQPQQQPYRQHLRALSAFASVPGNPAHQRLADLVSTFDGQHGPMY